MKSVTKLKDDARKHEQKEEWDKAIQAYLQVLKTGEEGEGELDLPLYNRVGDLYLRLSKPNDAVRYYVQAADRYAEAGLFNNAIALCNKALRYVPQQLDLLRKLGQFSASQGFLTDARRYFLEYAEKKFAGGQVDDALTALEEFAQASGDAEIRVTLARQLHAHGRTGEAVDELKKAYTIRSNNGDQAGADAVRDELEQLAPGSMRDHSPEPPRAAAPPSFASAPPAPAKDDEDDFAIKLPGDAPSAEADDSGLAGFESTHYEAPAPEDDGGFTLQGFETTHAAPETDDDMGGFSLPDFESTAHTDAADVGGDDLGLESTIFEPPGDVDAEDLPDMAFEPTSFDDDDDGGAVDLPLLGGDDDDATLSLDGDEHASLDLPGFEIEHPEEGAEDEAFDLPMLEDDGDADADMPGFDLPLLSIDDGTTTEAAPAVEPVDDGREFDDFGEFGLAPTPGASAQEAADDTAAELDLPASAPVAEEPAGGGWDPSALGFDEPAPPRPPAPPKKTRGKAKDGSDFIDLGSLLSDDDDDDDGTRFRVQEKAPTGDEDRDFAELLSQFKQKVSENVSSEDSAAHYDLGLAFKEMGLVDEAIGEFQIAMRSGDMRLKVYEELGQCFLLKDEFNIAEKVLKRALDMKHSDETELIGVYYHLGRAYEGLDNRAAAKDAYERVLGIDINFMDVETRLKQL